MKYKVSDLKKKTIESLGKSVIEAKLVAEDTTVVDKVQIWQGFPDFETITFGSVVEGDIVSKPNGKYTNVTLYAPKPKPTGANGGFGGVKVAQERKAEFIKEAQDRKADSIAYFNSVNSAIELVSKNMELYKDDDGIKDALVYWRDWFLEEYRKYEAKDIQDKRNAC